ncbi:hypothetical protein V2S66_33020 [Streptomyces sp. V4-01]|uniref:DUF3168 domain-containing protein n=1 Tax=Actinacidiphila polyblastidii TaxID=3110430 RepID=A0ABU7PLR7_9ACTN|nr:hypothetical protein [Streptomyces sp. V4-01]
MSTPIPVSTAPAARRYLFDQFTAQITADPDALKSSLLVCYDIPGPSQPDDIVAVGKVSRDIGVNSMVGGGGAGWLDERYSITVTLDVYRGGDSAQQTFERSFDLLNAVCAIVRADPTLGGAVTTARPVTSETEGDWDEQHKGFQTVTTVPIECYARI